VVGVVAVDGEPLIDEHVGDPLNALAREPPRACDLRHGEGGVLDRGEHPPPGARLAGGLGHLVSGRGEQAVQPEHVDHELAHGVAGRRSGRIVSRVDSMLSFP
jgi:hypothetical protein